MLMTPFYWRSQIVGLVGWRLGETWGLTVLVRHLFGLDFLLDRLLFFPNSFFLLAFWLSSFEKFIALDTFWIIRIALFFVFIIWEFSFRFICHCLWLKKLIIFSQIWYFLLQHRILFLFLTKLQFQVINKFSQLIFLVCKGLDFHIIFFNFLLK